MVNCWKLYLNDFPATGLMSFKIQSTFAMGLNLLIIGVDISLTSTAIECIIQVYWSPIPAYVIT